ncbi:2388_t:CDS:2, partial [Ambispora leptoticha]
LFFVKGSAYVRRDGGTVLHSYNKNDLPVQISITDTFGSKNHDHREPLTSAQVQAQ